MPTISMFLGIIIRMYVDDHNPPHFHAIYQDYEAEFDLDGNLLKGTMPRPQTNYIVAWCQLHHDELVANWRIRQDGEMPHAIEPLH